MSKNTSLEREFGVPTDDPDLIPYEDVFQEARGAVVEKPYIGETRMFDSDQVREAMYLVGRGNKNMKQNADGDFVAEFLRWHVPRNLRGAYKIDERFGPELEERIGPAGYALCNGMTRKDPRNPDTWHLCKGKAINRSGFCSRHGGALCPLDRMRIDWSKAPRHIKFKFGKLPATELDDEELARGQIRKPNGQFTDNNFVSTEIHKAMMQELFNRADVRLRENLVVAVDTAAEIASGKAYDEAVRLKAAQWMYETVRGKTPQKVEIGVDKKFEQVIDAVLSGGSREESRQRRGIELEDAIEAEVVEDDELDLPDLSGMETSPAEEDPISVDDWDYRDPRDRSLGDDLLPKPVEHVGAAGRITHDIPSDPDGRHEHWERYEGNVQESELRKEKIFKRREGKIEEAAQVAKDRAEHDEEKRKLIAKRKYFRKEGYDTFPEPISFEVVSVEDVDGPVEPDHDEHGAVILEPGDSVALKFNLEGLR